MQLWLMLPINGQAAFRVGHGVANRSAAMHVKVRKINSMGKPLFSGDPTRQAVFPGKLKVMENRIHALGRVVVTASIIDTIDANAATLIELYDAVLLWADEKRMRMRGFEDIDGIQYGQTWEIEFA
jgi:hypothetical protein